MASHSSSWMVVRLALRKPALALFELPCVAAAPKNEVIRGSHTAAHKLCFIIRRRVFLIVFAKILFVSEN